MPIGADPGPGVGFVASLARPGDNITGLNAYAPELNGKRLELLKEAVPKLTSVSLLMSPNIPRGNFLRDLEVELRTAARSLRIRNSIVRGARFSSALDGIFREMVKKQFGAFLVYPGSTNLVREPQRGRRTGGKASPAGHVSVGGLR